MIAEEGKLKAVAAEETRLGNEKNLAILLAEIKNDYAVGLRLSEFLRDYAAFEADAVPLTNTPESNQALLKIRKAIDQVNLFLNDKEKEINVRLRLGAAAIGDALSI